MYKNLIKANELNALLSTDNLVIIDCRFSLADTNWGRTEFKKGHIPKAIYAHLDDDLSGEIIPGTTGRHPFPTVDAFTEKCSQWGIDANTQVVVYDHGHGGIAARVWFLLKWLGHEQVAVLNGGWAEWQKEGFKVRKRAVSPTPKTFIAQPNPTVLVAAADLEKNLRKKEYLVIDSRTTERYRGEKEPIDPVAGHIPKAISAPFVENLGSDGLFLSKEQLTARFEKLLEGKPPNKTVFYCGSGVTACHNLLALDYIGRTGARLYPGSWSDWITEFRRPIAVVIRG